MGQRDLKHKNPEEKENYTREYEVTTKRQKNECVFDEYKRLSFGFDFLLFLLRDIYGRYLNKSKVIKT